MKEKISSFDEGPVNDLKKSKLELVSVPEIDRGQLLRDQTRFGVEVVVIDEGTFDSVAPDALERLGDQVEGQSNQKYLWQGNQIPVV